MLVISHRGNLKGPDKALENNPNHIWNVLDKFNVEVDVWFVNGEWFLGHDKPTDKVDYYFFREDMWIHCKNQEAVEGLMFSHMNWFWHENDKMTLTSHGTPWCSPGVYVKSGITVQLGIQNAPSHVLGICTDCPELYL